MPSYQTLLPQSIYTFLNQMSEVYSRIEKNLHVALINGEKIAAVEKRLQSKYQVDSTTVRNVYHNLKGKHEAIKEVKRTQTLNLKLTIKSISSATLETS